MGKILDASQKFCNILQSVIMFYLYHVAEAVQAKERYRIMVGSTVVDCALLCCALFQSVCDSKAA